MSRSGASAEAALAQLPALGAAWSLHAVAQLVHLLRFAPADRVAAGPRAAIAATIFALVLFEIAVAGLVNWGIERLAWRARRTALLDAAKSLLLAAPLALLLASTLKFSLTGSHLNTRELRFLGSGLRQVVDEATPGEGLGLLSLPLLTLVLAAALWLGFRRLRPGATRTRPPQLAALAVGAAAVLAAVLSQSPTARLFSATVVPETHWALRALPGPAHPSSAPAPATGQPISPYAPARPDELPNVILVMLESVPWSLTSAGGGRSGVTPVLDRLEAESTTFSHAYTTSTHSDYAQMAILSSLYPRKYDVHDYYTGLDYPRTLIWDALAPAGYATSVFSCQNETWGNMLSYLRSPGLELLRHSLDWPAAEHRGDGSESKVFEETPVTAWREWLATVGDRPFFTYLNFQANHFPYEVPNSAPRPFAPFEIDFPATFLGYPREAIPVMLNRFYNALHYSDRWLGEVVATLERRGSWERTILVVVSDHGEAFYEHGLPTHGTSLLEEQVRSLLLIRVPGQPARLIDEPVSLLDVAPTLLALLGLPPHGNFQGRGDILDPAYSAAGRALHFTIQGMTREDGVLLDGWKYLVNWDRRYRLLFDLAADPGERDNRLADRPDRAAELDAELRRLLAAQLGYYGQRGWEAGRYAPALP